MEPEKGGGERDVIEGLWQKAGLDTESSQSFSESDGDEYISSVSDYEMGREGEEGITDDQTTTQEGSLDYKVEPMSGGVKVGLPAELSALMLNRQELLRQCQLKQHIDKLEDEVQMKEDMVKKFRRQSYRCQEQQTLLQGEKAYLEEAMTGSSCLGMIHGRICKLMLDMETEKELEVELRASLSKAEDELLEAQMALNQFDHLREEAEKGEALWKELKELEYEGRLEAEKKLATNIKRVAFKERDLKEQQAAASTAVQEYKKAGKEERSFFQTALSQHKAAKAKEVAEEKHKQHLEKRMKAILSLKNNIANSEGTIQAKLLQRQEKALKQQAAEEEERKKILDEKGVPEEHFLRKQRLEQFQNMLSLFKQKQKERKLNIVEKLLREDKLNKQAKQGLQKGPRKSSGRRRKSKEINPTLLSSNQLAPDAGTGDVELRGLQESSASDTEPEELVMDALQGIHVPTLVEPEIRGLWDKASQCPRLSVGSRVPKPSLIEERSSGDRRGSAPTGEGFKKKPSKAEIMIMKNAMEKLKRSKVSKQIAAGREFKGQAFSCKPAAVVFRNFDVGKVYYKKVRLTNISYTVNRCMLEGVSNSIADFISVDFCPPGSMSAGMSCSMAVTFSPQLNEDIDGEILLLSQTGPFSLPVKCLTKKCLVSLEKSHYDFGHVYLGETLRQRVIVYNAGALTANYTVSAVEDSLEQATPLPSSKGVEVTETLSGVPGADSKEKLSERSTFSIMSNVEIVRDRGEDSSMLGVIPADAAGNRLKSKSMGVISFQSVPEGEEEEEEEEGEEGGATSQGRSSITKGSVHLERRSAPGGERPPLRLDTPSITLQGAAATGSQILVTGEESGEGSQESASPRSMSNILPEASDVKTSSEPTAPVIPAITVGGSPTGEVGPFGYYPIELVFTPHTVDDHKAKFLISFEEPSADTLEVTARGMGVDFPVYVEQEEMNLKICMLDRLYQTSVVLRNRASTALQVTFQVPQDLQPYLEVLPKHGVVQGEESFAAQLKFKPQDSLLGPDTKLKYYTAEDDLWRMPVQVGVAYQSCPVTFHVHAHVTPTEITFTPATLDFGWCTCHESVLCSLTVVNTSILPQTFGFLNLPPFVDIQPNDGFGELLPKEALQLDVIFSAKKPKTYEFDLICKSGLDKTYRVGCRGRGVLSPLALSHNTIKFKPTAVGGATSVRLSISNPRLDRLNSAVIRGTAPPAGTKAFQFNPPSGAPITFSPQVGVVTVGESVDIQVEFSPQLSEDNICERALSLAVGKAVEEEKARTPVESEVIIQSPDTKRKHKKRPKSNAQASPLVSITSLGGVSGGSPSSGNVSNADGSLHAESREPLIKKPSIPVPERGSELWLEAYKALLMEYSDECIELTIPCFVSNNVPTDRYLTPTFRTEYTLYLEVTAPAVRPKLILAHTHLHTVDFGSVGTGDVGVETLTLLNISTETLKLCSSVLNPNGPFELRNALRHLPPQTTHNLILHFAPTTGRKVYDSLVLREEGGDTPLLELGVVGVGVHPEVDVSLGIGKDLLLEMGQAVAKDVVSKSFTLYNSSPLKVRYHITMETQLPKKRASKSFRACNYSGQPPFVCLPREGVVEGKGTVEIRVFFSPDHPSIAYSDRLIVEYNGKCGCSVLVTGQAWTSNMYVRLLSEGSDTEDEGKYDDKESLIPTSLPTAPEDSTPPPPLSLLVMFVHKRKADSESFTRRAIEVGCIKSNLVKKATGDFSIDTQSSSPFSKCFAFDMTKGSVEVGSSKLVSIMFAPPEEPCSVVATNATLTLKGNITQVYQLMLRALISE